MARSPRFARLLRTLRFAAALEHHDIATAEGLERNEAARFSRRKALLGLGAAATAAVACATTSATTSAGNTVHASGAGGRARVLVVGAGLAGAVTAWRLHRAGVSVELLDAGSRVGGRAFTLRDQLPARCELGGEFIDSGHREVRELVATLGLSLVDLTDGAASLEHERYFLGGVPYREAQVLEMFRPVAGLVQRDLGRIGEGPVSYRRHTPAAESLDALSTAGWMDRNGVRGPLRALLDTAFTSELGLDLGAQSALTFLSMIGRDPEALRLYGERDARFVVREGTEAIVRALVQPLGARLVLDHALVALRREDTGGFALTFDRGGSTVTRRAERVVLALPFNQLRRCAVEVELPRAKRRAIEELPYGTNAKVMIATRNRPWREAGSTGTSFSDGGVYHQSWESTRGATGADAVMTAFSGGTLGVEVGASNPESQGRRFADALDLVYPGVASAYLQRAARMHWPSARWFDGSYACYGPGDWCTLAGAEGEAVGALHFAGEHTSTRSPGRLNGAVESGMRAVQEVLTGLGVRAVG